MHSTVHRRIGVAARRSAIRVMRSRIFHRVGTGSRDVALYDVGEDTGIGRFIVGDMMLVISVFMLGFACWEEGARLPTLVRRF